MTPELTKLEYFAALAMQSIGFKGLDHFQIANNVEDCCGEIAKASVRMAQELINHIDNLELTPKSEAYGIDIANRTRKLK